jgi:hypothetical protein
LARPSAVTKPSGSGTEGNRANRGGTSSLLPQLPPVRKFHHAGRANFDRLHGTAKCATLNHERYRMYLRSRARQAGSAEARGIVKSRNSNVLWLPVSCCSAIQSLETASGCACEPPIIGTRLCYSTFVNAHSGHDRGHVFRLSARHCGASPGPAAMTPARTSLWLGDRNVSPRSVWQLYRSRRGE